jgi:hypothetical protein
MKPQSFEDICIDSSVSAWTQSVGDTGLPPPEEIGQESDLALEASVKAFPYWVHRKIVYIDASIERHPSLFDNRAFIRMRTQYIPRMSAHERWVGGYCKHPGTWMMRDHFSNPPSWQQTFSDTSSWKVRIPHGHPDAFDGMYFCPDRAIETFSAADPLIVWVQNFHDENGTLISEGNRSPNDGNQYNIDRAVGYPFPNGGKYFRF